MSLFDVFRVNELRQEIRRLENEFMQLRDAHLGVIDQTRTLHEENGRLSNDLRSIIFKVDRLVAELDHLRDDRGARDVRVESLEQELRVYLRLMRSGGKIIEQHTGQLASAEATIRQIKSEQARLAKQTEIDNDEARSAALALYDQIAELRPSKGFRGSDAKTEDHPE